MRRLWGKRHAAGFYCVVVRRWQEQTCGPDGLGRVDRKQIGQSPCQFRRFCGVQRHLAHTDALPECSVFPDGLLALWRAGRHAASCLGGALDRGLWPRWNISTMRIGPPQSGHGSISVSGTISAPDGLSCLTVFAPSGAQIFATLVLRPALARRR